MCVGLTHFSFFFLLENGEIREIWFFGSEGKGGGNEGNVPAMEGKKMLCPDWNTILTFPSSSQTPLATPALVSAGSTSPKPQDQNFEPEIEGGGS